VGWDSACAVLSGGTVECWGYNAYGELGNGSDTGPDSCGTNNPCSTTPVPVTGLSHVTGTSVGSVAAGGALGPTSVCAVLSGGTVECWGGEDGWLLTSPNGGEPLTTPTAISGISTVTAIAVGDDFACALLSGGAVECWGNNEYGQLGDGTTTFSMTPLAVSGISRATAISAGATFACAVLSGGAVECWGRNESRELGNPMTTANYSSTPVAVSEISTATAVSAGAGNSYAQGAACALLSGGTVECWGASGVGELGNGASDATSSTPMPVMVSGINSATAISVGDDFACALSSGGTVECWGGNAFGQLGNGTTTGPQTCSGTPCSPTPIAVAGLSGATAISAGLHAACAVVSGGSSIECWGADQYGQLGNGTTSFTSGTTDTTNSPTPVAVSLR
jgi:alpha-tubulin suppressor-like RCC1 family protein